MLYKVIVTSKRWAPGPSYLTWAPVERYPNWKAAIQYTCTQYNARMHCVFPLRDCRLLQVYCQCTKQGLTRLQCTNATTSLNISDCKSGTLYNLRPLSSLLNSLTWRTMVLITQYLDHLWVIMHNARQSQKSHAEWIVIVQNLENGARQGKEVEGDSTSRRKPCCGRDNQWPCHCYWRIQH